MTTVTTIWKFGLMQSESQAIVMPHAAHVLTIQLQNGEAVLWARVDPKAETEVRSIYAYETGKDVKRDNLRYIATVQHRDNYVLHYFEQRQ